MKVILIVGLGGFIGSVSRYLINLSLIRIFPLTFPVGTFAVNMVGSLFLGIIYAFSEHHRLLSQDWRLFLAIGFCGSFTTFSTFAVEGLHLIEGKQWITFLAYIFGSVIGGILFAALGYYLANKAV